MIAELDLLDLDAPYLDETTPETTVWRDQGRPVAFGATRGAWHWLRVAGVGSYRFPLELQSLTIESGFVSEGRVGHAVVLDSFYRSVVPMALQAYGFEVLHGSAVALPGGVVAMCADRETGKSTIAFALQERGHGAVADDSVVVSVPAPGHGSRVAVQPLPFALRLRGPSARFFETPSKRDVLVSGYREPTQGDDLALAAIVMLVRQEGPVELARLEAREAFATVLRQSNAFSLVNGERKRSMVGNYLRLVNLVPTYRLAFPGGLEHLDSICASIERLAGPHSGG